jgi:hypothetical protein
MTDAIKLATEALEKISLFNEADGTCYKTEGFGEFKTVCTNGDQYQPEPKLVLWRTE